MKLESENLYTIAMKTKEYYCSNCGKVIIKRRVDLRYTRVFCNASCRSSCVLRERNIRNWNDPKYINKYYKTMRVRTWSNVERNRKLSATHKVMWKDQEYRETQIAAITNTEVRAKAVATMKQVWADPKYKAKMHKAMKHVWTDEMRDAFRQRQTKYMANGGGKRLSKTLRKQYASGERIPPQVLVGKQYSGWIITKKGGRIYYRGGWEKFFIALLESSDIVLTFKYQPFRIPYKYEGHMHTYLPDFLVILTNGEKWIVEIKGRIYPKDPFKFKAGEKYADKYGYEYVLINDAPIGSITDYIQ